VHKSGSLRPSFQDAKVGEEREPLLDTLENKEEVIIIAELPGVRNEDAKLDLTKPTIKIVVNTTERSYYKKLYLPAKVQQNSLEKSYRNGVLEIRLKKIGRKLVSVKKHLSPSD
jgi:HSP20 family protein